VPRLCVPIENVTFESTVRDRPELCDCPPARSTVRTSIDRRIARILHGGTEAARVHFLVFFLKKVVHFFSKKLTFLVVVLKT